MRASIGFRVCLGGGIATLKERLARITQLTDPSTFLQLTPDLYRITLRYLPDTNEEEVETIRQILRDIWTGPCAVHAGNRIGYLADRGKLIYATVEDPTRELILLTYRLSMHLRDAGIVYSTRRDDRQTRLSPFCIQLGKWTDGPATNMPDLLVCAIPAGTPLLDKLNVLDLDKDQSWEEDPSPVVTEVTAPS